ncbi:MAG: hypothetical protein QM809_03335 [Gordonia sp. (in: high G+C Gram-positive bacteria)]|uniref:hypothetical protein n=1 Tax=Gordonia sp. (in: high G+C Gram-positive bacteria) TaxID=84139 RepID=UPI0039E59E31
MTGVVGTDHPGDLAESVAAAVLAVPGVAGLSGGAFGAVATFGPGGRVIGIALRDEAGEVAIVGELGYDLQAVAERVRAAAEPVAGRPIDVLVADLRLPDDAPTDPESKSAPADPSHPRPAESDER